MDAGRLASFGPAASPDSGLRFPPGAHKGPPPSAEGQSERLATARSHAGRPTSFAGCTPFGVRRGRLKRNGTASASADAVFLWLWMLGVWRASCLCCIARLWPSADGGSPLWASGGRRRPERATRDGPKPRWTPDLLRGVHSFGVSLRRLKRNETAPAFVGAVFLWLWMLGVWRASGLLRRPALAFVFLRKPARGGLRQPKGRANDSRRPEAPLAARPPSRGAFLWGATWATEKKWDRISFG